MQGEYLHYSNNSFAYRFDEDGRIIDNMNGQVIGICNQKKREILDDYDAVNDENELLKTRLSEIEKAIEDNKEVLPDALLKFVQKPPSVESLQAEITELKSELKNVSELKYMLAKLLEERNYNSVDDNRAMPKSGVKPADSKGRGSKASVDGD